MSSHKAMSPNQREVLSALSTITGKQEYITSTGGVLNSGATLSGSAIPASSLTTAAAVQIVDGSGNQITSFGGGTQYTNGSAVVTPTGGVALGYDGANVRAMATDTVGNALSKITDGTNTVNVLKSDGTAVGKNAEYVSGTSMELASLTAGSLNADLITSTDISSYATFAIQVTGTFSGTLTFQQSNDNVNFVSTVVQASLVNNNPITSTTVTGVYQGTRIGRYLRVRMTAYVSGTATGTAEFYTSHSIPYNAFPVGQQGTWTVGSNSATGSAVPANAFYLGISSAGNLIGVTSVSQNGDGGTMSSGLPIGNWVYNGTTWDRMRQATSANGTTGTGLGGMGILGFDGTNYRRIATDTSGNITVQPGNTANTTPWLVNAALNPSGTALNTFSVHLTSNTTTTPVASTAYISSISISNEVGGTTSTITVQDKSATPLKLVNGVATTALTTTPTVINFQSPVKMTSGIDIITAGVVAATVDVWVNYYV